MRARKLLVLLPIVLLGAACLSCGGTAGGHLPSSISGLIADAEGQPLEGCHVHAEPWDGNAFGSASTDPDGSYTISGVKGDNDYLVGAGCPGYITEYYSGVREPNGAARVHVLEGQDTPDINFNLDLAGTISGSATDDLENPLDDCWVYVTPWDDSGTYGSGQTSPDGSYTIDGLGTGDYRVNVKCDGHVSNYFDGVPGRDEATPVSVVEGQDTPSIDFSLGLLGTISGVVTDGEGNPLNDCRVFAQSVEDPIDGGIGFTDIDGSYTTTSLAAGEYRLDVECDGYIREDCKDPGGWDGRSPVTVIDGQDTPDINLCLGMGSSISGVVTDAQGNPIEGANVWASRGVGPENAVVTKPDGSYTITTLPPSSQYLVWVLKDGYAGEHYGGVRWEEDATLINVVEGQNTPDIDFALDPGGGISGVVTDEQGRPIAGAQIYVGPYDHSSSWWGWTQWVREWATATSRTDGSYHVDDLGTGGYVVRVEAECRVTEYYPGVHDENEAQTVYVTEPQRTGGISFSLEPDSDCAGLADSADN